MILSAARLNPATQVEGLLEAAREQRQTFHTKRLRGSAEAKRFMQAVAAAMGLPLNRLHRHVGPYPLFQPAADNTTATHQRFYAQHAHQRIQYLDLCRRVIRDLIGEPCYVQAIPTYRFGLPGNRWVGSFHRDSDFGHSPYELNAICALTPMVGSAALQVEQVPGSHHFAPLELEPAEVVLFDHIDRLHGCLRSREEHSVASIDFRFVPERFAAAAFATTASSVNTATPLVPGAYFSLHPLHGGEH
jgi:hypothetical protein